jgi:deoxyinosine 3'endonuclease (endonuclease V)
MSELTEAQRDVLESLKDSYARYNDLVMRVIAAVDFEYETQYELKRAVLTAISNSLGNK